jgi:hypothetical protein
MGMLPPSPEDQIPPDLVVKTQVVDIVALFHNCADGLTLFKRHGETGNHGVSGFHHLRPIGPPLNPMDCGIFHFYCL